MTTPSTPARPTRKPRLPPTSASSTPSAPRSSFSAVSSASPPTSSVIAKGATARSAVPSPRNGDARRATAQNGDPLNTARMGNGLAGTLSHDSLVDALKRETEAKEELMVQIQDRDSEITGLRSDSQALHTNLTNAQSQLQEFYTEQGRMEDELATHHAITEKLREQMKELDIEKRDLSRMYNEQAKAFEAERQSFYDNEQHLKSRIQSLTQQRKAYKRASIGSKRRSISSLKELEHGDDLPPEHAEQPGDLETNRSPSDAIEEEDEDEESQEGDEDTDPPEISALKMELSTLTTSHVSMQSTIQHLQTQVSDLQRLNNQLQDENESYNILLREKAMAGQFDIIKNLGGGADDGVAETDGDGRSIRSVTRSTLDRVSELDELAMDDVDAANPSEVDPFEERPASRTSGRKVRNATGSPLMKGESLAGLPITGPGLDLAAELGRAENRDPDESALLVGNQDSPARGKPKRINRAAELKGTDVDTLRKEVKSLKDANKALSLYASKIIDRIIAQDGFEHVLAVDYNETTTPTAAVPPSPKPLPKKPRPQSTFFSSGVVSTSPDPATSDGATSPSTPLTTQIPTASPNAKRDRRSMSFDWKSLSLWGNDKKAEPAQLRPLTLRPGATSVVGAKKLETFEDEEDRIERERLNATMKLMGIDPPPPQSPILVKSFSNDSSSVGETNSMTSTSKVSRRWSLFRSNSTASRESPEPSQSPQLTTEALKHVEASEAIKQRDEEERERIEALSKGSGSGFTETAKPRLSLSDEWRSRRDARHGGHGSTGSASTVWSAGMSARDEISGTPGDSEPSHDHRSQ